MRGVSIAAAAIVALALATGCGGGGGSPSTTGSTPIPTKDVRGYATQQALRPTPTPTATSLIASPDTRPCEASDLTSDVRSNAFTNGGLTLSIDLGNGSQTPCQVSRLPDVRFLGPAGDIVPIDTSLGDSIFPQPLLLPPDLGSLDPLGHLTPGQVRMGMSWHIHNGAGTCPTPPPEGDIVRLSLPDGGGDLDIDVTKELSYGGSPGFHGVRPCGGTVYISSFGPY